MAFPTIRLRDLRRCWTLTQSTSRVSCVVMTRRGGGYVLRLTCNGRRIFDQRFAGLPRAIDRSDDAFTALFARGWLPEETGN
jgi:hypothetical protein